MEEISAARSLACTSSSSGKEATQGAKGALKEAHVPASEQTNSKAMPRNRHRFAKSVARKRGIIQVVNYGVGDEREAFA